MTGKKSTQREQDVIKAQIAALWARGQSASKIAPQVNKSARQVRRYLDALRDEWITSIADHNNIRMQQLAELGEVKLEAWEAWEKSKREQKAMTVESKGPPKEEGAPQRIRGRNNAQQLSRISTQTTAGEPRYLQLLLDSIDAQNKLLGLVVIKHAETDSRGNDKPAISEDERAARVVAILDAARARRTGHPVSDSNAEANMDTEPGSTGRSIDDASG